MEKMIITGLVYGFFLLIVAVIGFILWEILEPLEGEVWFVVIKLIAYIIALSMIVGLIIKVLYLLLLLISLAFGGR